MTGGGTFIEERAVAMKYAVSSVNSMCYEGVCRIYRNSCVQHIRKVLTAKYPSDHGERIRDLFSKEEWAAIERNAKTMRETGEMENPLVDDFDLLGVNHFHNVFEVFFDDLFPPTGAPTPDSRKAQKQTVLNWARLVKKLRDPALGHPGEEDLSRNDAFVLLDAAKRIVRLFDDSAAQQIATIIEAIVGQDVQQLIPAVARRSVDSSTLPPREAVASDFIGRDKEIGLLMEWVQKPKSHLWLLAGDGGKGKTSIAYEFASRLCSTPPQMLEAVIWLSAKRRRFVSGQTVQAQADFNDLSSALDIVLSVYGVATGGLTLDMKKSKGLEYLEGLPALVVLDDVDSLEGDQIEALNFFMFELAKMPSKVLLTSRRVTHFGMEPITTQITGFDPTSKDGADFVASRVHMFGLDKSLVSSKKLVEQIVRVCDGSPLFIEDLLRLCSRGVHLEKAIDVWRKQEGEAARRYALGREYEMLSMDARKVLLACALYITPVSIAEISVAVNMPSRKVQDAIDELQNNFLVPKPRLIQDEPRFSLNLNTRQLVLDVNKDTDLARRVERCIAVATEKMPTTPGQRSKIGQYIRSAVSLVKLARHAEAEAALLEGLQLFPESADLHGSLGWVYKHWSPRCRLVDARNEFRRAAELKGKNEDLYVHWAQMEANEKEWTKAAEAAESGLAVLPKNLRLGQLAGSARLNLGKSLISQAQVDLGEQEFRKAEKVLVPVLGAPEDTQAGEYFLRGQVYRALVLTYEQLVKITSFPRAGRTNVVRERFLRLLRETLSSWRREHPSDVNATSEYNRLVAYYPELADGSGLLP